jgi:hypothetical protein
LDALQDFQAGPDDGPLAGADSIEDVILGATGAGSGDGSGVGGAASVFTVSQPDWLEMFTTATDETLPEPEWLSTLLSTLEPSGGGGGGTDTSSETITPHGEELGVGQRTSATSRAQQLQQAATETPAGDRTAMQQYIANRGLSEGQRQAINNQSGGGSRNKAAEKRNQRPRVDNTNDVTVDATLDIRNVRELRDLLQNPERWVRNNLNINGRGP